MVSNPSSRRLAWVLVGTLGLALSSGAQTERTGRTASGAYYRIAVPDGWQPADGLVIWNHGFDLGEPAPDPDLGPLADTQLAEGYAVAASSYSLGGWALFETTRDNRQMVRAFEAEFGVPDQVLVTGASMGGLVTAQLVEGGGFGNVVGALPICGAVAGSRLWDGALDLRLLYDVVCGDVPGASIPGGAGGLPFPPDPLFDSLAAGFALNLCTGILQTPATRTTAQRQRLDKLLRLTGLPEEFLITDFGYATFGLNDLVFDPRKLNGGSALPNVNVDYGDAVVNRDIERVSAESADRKRLLDHFTPTGKVGDVKIVSLHTDKDGLVVVENASAYASVVPRRNLTTGIVVEDAPSHCGFSEAEVLAAWESLRGWVAGLPQPSPSTLQSTCEALATGGLAQGPCRIDPGFVVGSLDERVRPRGGVCVADEDTLCLGAGRRFQVEIAWRDFESNRGRGRTTAFRTDDSGSFWFFDPANVELFVKVLDARGVNGHVWVFFGSLTNVELELTVTDTTTGVSRVYENPLGTFASVGDTEAF